MNTSPREERAVEKTVIADKQKELETRLVLHEHYADWTKLMQTKLKRVTNFMEQLRSPDVDMTTLRRNTLWDEDRLDELADDLELYAMAYPEWRRPEWVKKLERRCM